MSPQEQTGAQTTAERLAYAVRRLSELDGIRTDQHVSVGWKPWAGEGELELDVHGCEPHELDTHRAYFVGCREHRDADGILRWIEVDLEGVQATFYRR